ncbi:MAG TPA: hypothetical protein VG867_00895 [Rhizomicrobium sp.]|nr:hypothetical protein [Rhizomicrobium sp.]
MRTTMIAGAVLASMAAFCAPAYAGDSALGPNDEIVPIVAPGEQIGIACDALQVAQQNSDVRVVLTVSAKPGEKSTGYDKVLATDQQVARGAVRVKVPKLPDIADHTYDLSVYVTGEKGSQSCDAGHFKVANRLSMLSEQSGSQHS